MTQHNHQTAPTQFVEASGIRFAYRRFGNTAGAPLVFNHHFTGTMDHWDPAVTDGFAKVREVILFNNAGVVGRTYRDLTSWPELALGRCFDNPFYPRCPNLLVSHAPGAQGLVPPAAKDAVILVQVDPPVRGL